MSTPAGIRLFVDAHVFDSEFQGTRTFIKGIYTILAGQPGLVIYMAAFDTDNLKKNFPDHDNIVFIKYRSTSGFTRLITDIPSIIRKYDIQYAHFQYITPVFKNCRYITTTHDVIFNEYPAEFSLTYRLVKNFLFKVSALRSDIITTVSAYSRKSIRKYLKVKSKEIHVVPNGVAEKFFVPYDKAASKSFIANKYGIGKFILYVSRIEPRKNHILLLKAWLELELYRQDCHLVLLGHQSIRVPGLDETLNGLPENVKRFIYIKSDIGDTDLLEFYRSALLFVYPSKAEGFGIPPLEAAALKTPVLCSNTSAMSAFDFFGEDLINPLDDESFKTKLQHAVNNPHNEAYLDNLSGIIRREYSWARSAQKLYEIILKDKKH